MSDAMVPAGDNRISFGQTHLDAGDFVPPRVKVIQAMSDELDVKGEKGQVINVGDWYNTLTSEAYGPSLRFAPILPFKQRIFITRADKGRDRAEQLLGVQLSEGDGLKCRSFDMIHGQGEPGILCEACPLSQWEGNTPPPCSETYNIAGVTEIGDLIILGFSRSSARVGKQMFSQLRLSAGLPWGFVYEATTYEEKGALGRYQVPRVRRIEPATPELQTLAVHFAKMLDGVVIDVSPSDDDVPRSSPDSDPGFAPWEARPASA